MQFLVAPIIMPQPGMGGGEAPRARRGIVPDREFGVELGGSGSIKFPNSKDRPTGYYNDVAVAEAEAKKLAEANPGVNYAVFIPASIYEGRKAAVDIVAKQINANGELVVKPVGDDE